jgi:S-formylglutathione hydrolase FrmB
MKHMRLLIAMAMVASFVGWKAPLGHAQEKRKSDSVEIKREMQGTSRMPEGCSIEKLSVYSPSMGRGIDCLVILPPEYKNHPEKSYPIVYALPGAWGGGWNWAELAPLRQAIKDKPMIVASMDAGMVSFYVDWDTPQQVNPKNPTKKKSLYTTFFFDELIPCIDQNYRVNPKQRMITGVSMGSSGAFHYMMMKPEMFVSVSTFCSCYAVIDHKHSFMEALKNRARQKLKIPLLYIRVGTEDHMLQSSRDMHKFLTELGIPHDYLETPGKHNYQYAGEMIPGAIDFHWRSLQPQAPSASRTLDVYTKKQVSPK